MRKRKEQIKVGFGRCNVKLARFELNGAFSFLRRFQYYGYSNTILEFPDGKRIFERLLARYRLVVIIDISAKAAIATNVLSLNRSGTVLSSGDFSPSGTLNMLRTVV